MDPWSGGGLLTPISDTVVALFIKDGAHHYDLPGKHARDTSYVKEARRIEVGYIKKWLKQYSESSEASSPSAVSITVP